MRKYVTAKEFDAWVERMYEEFLESRAITEEYGRSTYVYLRSKTGKATRCEQDKNNFRIGIAYAFARCTGQDEYYIKDPNIPCSTGYCVKSVSGGKIFIPLNVQTELKLKDGDKFKVLITTDSIIYKKIKD